MRILALFSFAAVICFSGSADADFVDIQVVSTDGTVTGARLAQFDAAAAIWEGILNEYSVDVPDGTFVSIDASISFIDGPGGTLGQAGPNGGFTEGSFLYTSTGFMQFDSADVPTLDGNGTLDAVILHEMAHVMGFGTLWNGPALGVPGTQEVYVNGSGEYTGAMALALWQTEFGQAGDTFVPVELGGGGGTANGHWNEVDGGAGPTGFTVQFGPNAGRDLQNELMTGWLNSDPFISDMTRASFGDIGYNVVLAIPEPSSFLVLLGISAFGLVRRRTK